MTTIPNKNIYSQQSANLGLEVGNGRAHLKIFNGLNVYR
jgi:hypothetical protein